MEAMNNEVRFEDAMEDVIEVIELDNESNGTITKIIVGGAVVVVAAGAVYMYRKHKAGKKSKDEEPKVKKAKFKIFKGKVPEEAEEIEYEDEEVESEEESK